MLESCRAWCRRYRSLPYKAYLSFREDVCDTFMKWSAQKRKKPWKSSSISAGWLQGQALKYPVTIVPGSPLPLIRSWMKLTSRNLQRCSGQNCETDQNHHQLLFIGSTDDGTSAWMPSCCYYPEIAGTDNSSYPQQSKLRKLIRTGQSNQNHDPTYSV